MTPSGWAPVRLGDLVEIKHGWPFKSELFSADLSGRPIVVSIGNFRYTGGFRFSETSVKEYRGAFPREYELAPGDVLLVMTCQTAGGEILGIPGRIPDDGRVYLHNQRLGKVVTRDGANVDHNYLYWLFLSPEFNRALVNTASGTKILHTAPSRIEAFEFRLPSRQEQLAISRILGALDDKIELNRRTSETLEAMARALFKSWFVDFDPVRAKEEGRDSGLPREIADLFPSRFVDSEIGKIPADWGVTRVDEDFNVTMGQSPPGETYNEVGEGLPFYQGRADFGTRFPRRRVYCAAPTRFAKRGDTLISVRAPVGDINMATEHCAIGRGVAAARHKGGGRSYTYQVMRNLEDVFARFDAEGTVFGSISKKDFHGIPCLAPRPAIINAFEEVVSSIDSRIEIAAREGHTLAALRNALLPKLISGELRIMHAGIIAERATR
jgi:type I restriction enzyme S subunit